MPDNLPARPGRASPAVPARTAVDTAASRPLGGDWVIANRFLFKLDGVEVGIFKEVRGLEVTVATESINEGGQNQFTHKVPGRMSWPNIVLKRGITESNALFEWLTSCSGEGFASAHDTMTYRNGHITALDSEGTPLRAWQLNKVFPVRWKGPDFAVDSGNVLEEELEIVHHGFRAVKPVAGPSNG